MVPARPTGQSALSAAPNRRKSETSLLHVQVQEAPLFARRLLSLAMRQGVLRLWPSRSRCEGRSVRGPFGALC
eukprot:2991663-Alexandrium_andersonii.AAC.1